MPWLEPVTLRGAHARLEPLSHDQRDGLIEAVRDGGKAASLIPGPPPEAPRGIQFHQFNGIPNGARLALLAQQNCWHTVEPKVGCTPIVDGPIGMGLD